MTMRLTSSSVYTRPPPVPRMPAGLVDLMEDLTRNVLRHNPPDVYEFCADHMAKLIEIRDGRAPKQHLTLEQKIARAQKKVRQWAEQKRQQYDKEMELWALKNNENHKPKETEEQVVEETASENTLKYPVHHEQDLNNALEVEIFHEANENSNNLKNNESLIKGETDNMKEEVHVNTDQIESHVKLNDESVPEKVKRDDANVGDKVLKQLENAAVTILSKTDDILKNNESDENVHIRKSRSVNPSEEEAKSSVDIFEDTIESDFDVGGVEKKNDDLDASDEKVDILDVAGENVEDVANTLDKKINKTIEDEVDEVFKDSVATSAGEKLDDFVAILEEKTDDVVDITTEKIENTTEIADDMAGKSNFVAILQEKTNDVVDITTEKIENITEIADEMAGKSINVAENIVTNIDGDLSTTEQHLEEIIDSAVANPEKVVTLTEEVVNKISDGKENTTGSINKDVEKIIGVVNNVESNMITSLTDIDSIVETSKDDKGNIIEAVAETSNNFVDAAVSKLETIINAATEKADNSDPKLGDAVNETGAKIVDSMYAIIEDMEHNLNSTETKIDNVEFVIDKSNDTTDDIENKVDNVIETAIKNTETSIETSSAKTINVTPEINETLDANKENMEEVIESTTDKTQDVVDVSSDEANSLATIAENHITAIEDAFLKKVEYVAAANESDINGTVSERTSKTIEDIPQEKSEDIMNFSETNVNNTVADKFEGKYQFQEKDKDIMNQKYPEIISTYLHESLNEHEIQDEITYPNSQNVESIIGIEKKLPEKDDLIIEELFTDSNIIEVTVAESRNAENDAANQVTNEEKSETDKDLKKSEAILLERYESSDQEKSKLEDNISDTLENVSNISEPVNAELEISFGKSSSMDDSAIEDSHLDTKAIGNETESQHDNNPNTMDLETAAVTIQKVFRTFMFKSRGSTFDDTGIDETNLTDEDNDKEVVDFPLTSNPNKERRTLGISRMDTVLQTVNEEKSLSLSTDDSSTLSSAATIIQSHVRGYLVRNKLNSNKTASSTSLINSEGPSTQSLEADPDQKNNKTVLNIIVPEGGHFVSRDESMITSMDLSLDSSPPSSINLHPLGYDKSEPRKQLKREDAIQSISPPSNNSGKLSEEVDSVKELLINDTEQPNVSDLALSELRQNTKEANLDISVTESTTMETVIEPYEKSNDDSSSPDPENDNLESLTQNVNDSSVDRSENVIDKANDTSPTKNPDIETDEAHKYTKADTSNIDAEKDNSKEEKQKEDLNNLEAQKDKLESNRRKKSLMKMSSDESDVVTPFVDDNKRTSDSNNGSKLEHSGEFHDIVLPTKVARTDTPVVREFKNVLAYFLIWNNS